MKFQIVSDLHLERLAANDPSRLPAIAPQADALILAGDIGSGIEGVRAFRHWPVPVLYVPGNHEFFGGEVTTVRAALAAMTAAERGAVVVLDGVVHEASDRQGQTVRIIGTTLWTDFNLMVPETHQAAAMKAAQDVMRDYRHIRIGEAPMQPKHTLAEHRRHRAWLSEALQHKVAHPTVVITHHGPSRHSIHPKYANHPVNAAFASDLEALMPGVRLWVHGHTHASIDYTIHGCRVVANPRGYRLKNALNTDLENGHQNETWENARFDALAVVAVPAAH